MLPEGGVTLLSRVGYQHTSSLRTEANIQQLLAGVPYSAAPECLNDQALALQNVTMGKSYGETALPKFSTCVVSC